MFSFMKFIYFLLSLVCFNVLVNDCLFLNQLFSNLENNILCIFFFNNFFFLNFKQICIINYTNIHINMNLGVNNNLLNGSINIHPIFFLILINFIFIKYHRLILINLKILFSDFFVIYDFYLYLGGIIFMLLGIYWASQELLWGLWWSWDLIEIFLLILLTVLVIKNHFLKKNPIGDFFFYKNLFLLFLLFFFFNKLNIINSLHSFNSISGDNYIIYFIYIYILYIVITNNNYLYLSLLLILFFKNMYAYMFIFVFIFNISKLLFLNNFFIKPFLFLFFQFFFKYNLKHILFFSSMFYWLSATHVFSVNIPYLNYFYINQNFLNINNYTFLNFLFEFFFLIQINKLFFNTKNLFLDCINNFFNFKFFLIFLFFFIFFNNTKIILFY